MEYAKLLDTHVIRSNQIMYPEYKLVCSSPTGFEAGASGQHPEGNRLRCQPGIESRLTLHLPVDHCHR